MSTVEKYLRPEVIRQIARLDLRAQFIVKGFLQGMHASPFHGFSVEFSEHRKYTPGDDPQDIDWLVYAKTDKYYIKKFEAETNITGYLVMDLSSSMGYTYRQELTKFEYGICLAAALCYLMVHQQDPVGLITFDEKIRQSLPARSKRTQIGHVLSLLANLKPTGKTDIARSLQSDHGHAEASQPGDAVQRFAGGAGGRVAIAAAAAAWRARRDPVSHSRRSGSAVPVRRHGGIRGSGNARQDASRREPVSVGLREPRCASFATIFAANAFKAASTTSAWTPACSSTRRWPSICSAGGRGAGKGLRALATAGRTMRSRKWASSPLSDDVACGLASSAGIGYRRDAYNS